MTDYILDETKEIIIINGVSHKLWGKEHNEADEYNYLLEDIEENEFEKLISLEPSKFPNLFSVSSFLHYKFEYIDFYSVTRINNKTTVRACFNYMWNRWNHIYPFEDYLESMVNQLKQLNEIKNLKSNLDHDNNMIDIDIEFECQPNEIIKNRISNILDLISEIHDKTCIELKRSKIEDILSLNFKIPEPYRSSFNQYLCYFSEFLYGLGLQSETSIQQIGSQTIFEIKPLDKDKALSDILNALNLYFAMSDKSNEITIHAFPNIESEVRTQQLLSAIDHLRSQLRLSEALISLREKELSLYKENSYIDNIKIDRRIEINSNEKNHLTIFNGTLKIQEYKGKFFTIDIPKVVKSILKLNKST